jgi:WD40 repeat protein
VALLTRSVSSFLHALHTQVWHWPSGRCVRTLHVGTGVCALTQLRNGRLVVAGDTPVVTLWNWVAGACEVTLDGHCNYVRCVTQLADGRVCTGSMDNTLKLWR